MDGRHEVKHYISLGDYYALRSRLRAVLRVDAHAGPDGHYQIRSLYFDTPDDRALREKLDGSEKYGWSLYTVRGVGYKFSTND